MASDQSDKTVKKGSFLYDGSARCKVEIVQTNLRPGLDDHEAPVDDAYGEFYEVRYYSAGSPTFTAGGGYYDSLAEAIHEVETMVRDIKWDD